MTVTLHLPADPAARSAMLRRLVELAGGRKAIRSGHGGLVVSDEVALAYLAAASAGPAPPPSTRILTPDVARVVRGAETRGGLLDRPTAAAQTQTDPAPKSRPAARRPRRLAQQQGATT